MTTRKKTLLMLLVLVVAGGIAAVAWHLLHGCGSTLGRHREALKILPVASVVVSMDAEHLTDKAFELLEEALGFRVDDAGTRRDVGALFQDRLGTDPLKIRTLTAFELDGLAGAILYGLPPFTPKDPRTREYKGRTFTQLAGDTWTLPLGEGLAVGFPPVLEALVDVEKGERKSLADEAAGKVHEALLDELGGGVLVATVVIGPTVQAKLLEDILPEGSTIEGLGLRVSADGDSALLLKADDTTRNLLRKQLDALLARARTEVKAARGRLDDLDPAEGVAVIVADRHLDTLFGRIAPEDDGEFLRLELRGAESGVLAAAGVGAAVAVPSFIKYTQKAKTAEAVDLLDRIYKGAIDYYTTPRISMDTGEKLPCQFPEDAPLTPPGGCNAAENDRDGDGRCDSNPDAWSFMAWSALKFQISDQHYFQYSFDSEGTGADARFTAHAQADLDGDGIFSTFQRYGKGSLESYGECSVSMGAALYIDNETE